MRSCTEMTSTGDVSPEERADVRFRLECLDFSHDANVSRLCVRRKPVGIIFATQRPHGVKDSCGRLIGDW